MDTDNTAMQEPIPVPQPAAPKPGFSKEQIDQIKIALINNFAQTYHQFIQQITNLPSEPNIKEEALKHMYIGFVLFKDAIVNLPTDRLSPPPAPQPQAQQEPTKAPEAAPAPEAPAPVNDAAPEVPPAA